MPILWVLGNNIDKNNDYLSVLGGCLDHWVRIGGFSFGFEGPTWNRVSVLKLAGTGSIMVLQLGGNWPSVVTLSITRNRLEGWFQIDIRIQTRLKYWKKSGSNSLLIIFFILMIFGEFRWFHFFLYIFSGYLKIFQIFWIFFLIISIFKIIFWIMFQVFQIFCGFLFSKS